MKKEGKNPLTRATPKKGENPAKKLKQKDHFFSLPAGTHSGTSEKCTIILTKIWPTQTKKENPPKEQGHPSSKETSRFKLNLHIYYATKSCVR